MAAGGRLAGVAAIQDQEELGQLGVLPEGADNELEVQQVVGVVDVIADDQVELARSTVQMNWSVMSMIMTTLVNERIASS